MYQEANRFIYDVSHLLRHAGPPTGISRVDRELARWAIRNVPAVRFALFDPAAQVHRFVDARVVEQVWEDQAFIDWSRTSKPVPSDRFGSRLSSVVGPVAAWILRPRPQLLFVLEQWRRQSAAVRLRRLVEWAQSKLMNEKYRRKYFRSDGTRRSLVARQADILGDEVVWSPRDILFCAGAIWGYVNLEVLRSQKSATGFKLVCLCYDLIPTVLPQFHRPQFVELFRHYLDSIFAASNLVLFSAEKIERDARAYCRLKSIAMPRAEIVPYGVPQQWSAKATNGALPGGLRPQKFAMFVSTLDTRKNHKLLVEVWEALMEEGIPQASEFKLVFVGRVGDAFDEVMGALDRNLRLKESILVLTEVDDEQLGALYRAAAFCLFPSYYEGFGLSVIECLQHGKPIISSNGGALPEVVGEFSPCLDPGDYAAWRSTIKDWIQDPRSRERYEVSIREKYTPLSWDVACQRVFSVIAQTLDRA